MIDAIDQWLEEWTTSTVGGVDVRHSMPLAKVVRPTAVLVLLKMAYEEPDREQPGGVVLHYLVTVCAETIEAALPMIDDLFVAALEDEELGVDHQPIAADVWETIGARPQPSFRLVVPLQFPPARAGLPPSRGCWPKPSLATFDGVVLGPDGEPIPRARVQSTVTQDSAYSDRFGRFRFPSAVAASAKRSLQAFASGLEHAVVEAPESDAPVVIRFKSHACRSAAPRDQDRNDPPPAAQVGQ